MRFAVVRLAPDRPDAHARFGYDEAHGLCRHEVVIRAFHRGCYDVRSRFGGRLGTGVLLSVVHGAGVSECDLHAGNRLAAGVRNARLRLRYIAVAAAVRRDLHADLQRRDDKLRADESNFEIRIVRIRCLDVIGTGVDEFSFDGQLDAEVFPERIARSHFIRLLIDLGRLTGIDGLLRRKRNGYGGALHDVFVRLPGKLVILFVVGTRKARRKHVGACVFELIGRPCAVVALYAHRKVEIPACRGDRFVELRRYLCRLIVGIVRERTARPYDVGSRLADLELRLRR